MTDELKKDIYELIKDDSHYLKDMAHTLITVCENELVSVKNQIDEDFYEELKEEDERFEDISDTMLKKLVSLTTQKFCEELESEFFDEPYGIIPALSEGEYVDRENEQWRKEHPKQAICSEKRTVKYEGGGTSVYIENCETYMKNKKSCKGCEYNVDDNEQPITDEGKNENQSH